jgi:hypothetical protein
MFPSSRHPELNAKDAGHDLKQWVMQMSILRFAVAAPRSFRNLPSIMLLISVFACEYQV